MKRILFLFCAIILATSLASAVLIENSTDNRNKIGNLANSGFLTSDGSLTVGQSFRIGISSTNTTYTLTNISIPFAGTFTNVNVTVHIKLANGTGYPQGNDIANGTINMSTSVNNWTNFPLTSFTDVIAGGTYFFYLNTTTTTFTTYLNTTNMYSGGTKQISQDAQQTWADVNSGQQDMYFEVYGITQGGAGSVSVLQDKPINGTLLTMGDILFNVTITPTIANITNATIFVWNTNGSLVNMTTNVVNGSAVNTTNWTINLGNGAYLWNVLAFGRNGTAIFSDWGDNNFSLTIAAGIDSVSYVNSTFETSSENFSLTFSSSTILSASGNLIYNNTAYPSTITCSSGSCTASNTIDIPLISSTVTTQNNSFSWALTVFDGTSSIAVTSQSYTHTVSLLNMTNCNVGSRVFNFTVFDEANLTRISPFVFEGDFQYYKGSGTVFKNLSISNSSAGEIYLCIHQNTTNKVNAIIAYSAPNATSTYATRNWFYQNYVVRNSTEQVPMSLLKSTASTSFIIQVQGRDLSALPGVLVEPQRCYPGNFNRTVFKSRTDANGLTVGNFEAETALYQFFITNQSNVLLAVTPCSKVVPTTVPYTLTFQLGDTYASPFSNIDNVTDIDEDLFYNATSNTVTLTYIDTSGQFSSAELIVKSLNYTSTTQSTICDSNNTLSSATLTCNMTGLSGSFVAQAYVYRTSQILIDQITFDIQTFSSTVGYYGVFLGWFIILICGFAFRFNEIVAIWLINAAVICCNWFGLIYFGKVFVTALLAISIIITAVLER